MSLRPLAAGLLASAWPSEALACAVCFSGAEESRIAFIVTTVFMTFLPLLVIGAGVWWLAKRAREAERERERR